MRVSKWGNSLAIRIPKDVADSLDLRVGDEIELQPVSRKSVAVSRQPTRDELIDRIRQMAKPLPAGWKFDREEANAR